MKKYLLSAVFGGLFALASLFLISAAAVVPASAQDSPQKAKASKTAKFGSVLKTDALYTGAIDAHNKEAAAKVIDTDGAFKGKVTKVFTTRNGGILILNFDADYKTAMTAVLKKSDFSRFPDMSQLDGNEIVVTGKFIDYQGNPEIMLTDPDQIKVVK